MCFKMFSKTIQTNYKSICNQMIYFGLAVEFQFEHYLNHWKFQQSYFETPFHYAKTLI